MKYCESIDGRGKVPHQWEVNYSDWRKKCFNCGLTKDWCPLCPKPNCDHKMQNDIIKINQEARLKERALKEQREEEPRELLRNIVKLLERLIEMIEVVK